MSDRLGRTPLTMAVFCALAWWGLAAAAMADESIAERLQRIEEMTPIEKEELSRHAEQFRTMSDDERRQIRLLHDQLQDDPDGENLRATMHRYCEWLAKLPPYRRAELIEMDPAKRVKQIKQIMQEQAKTAASQLGTKDCEVVVQWMEKYAERHAAKTIATPEARRFQFAKMSPALQQRIVMGLLCQRWQSTNPAAHPPVTEPERNDLRSRLSDDARGRLERLPTTSQTNMLAAWLRQVAKQEIAARREGASMIPGLDEQLADFFEFQLNDTERDRLMSLPGAEMQQKLREMYLTQTKPAAVNPKAKKTGKAAAKPTGKKRPPSKTTPAAGK